MSLKTDYKNDMFSGKRKYQVTQNTDGTISLDDVTVYEQQGDVFSADDINATNIEVNKNTQGLVNERNETNNQITQERNTTNQQITQERNYVDGKFNTINKQISNINAAISEIKVVRKFTLTTGGWSSSAPYTQTVNVSGITSADTPIPLIEYPDNVTADQKNQIDKGTNMITSITTNNGSVTVVCKFKKPTINLTIALKGE